MYAIVNHIDGQGVVVVHTRWGQCEANGLAVQLCIEQGLDEHAIPEQQAAYKEDVLQTLQEHGVWSGNGWTVTVIEIEGSPDLLTAPLTLREARKRMLDHELVVTLCLDVSDFSRNVEDLNDLVEQRIVANYEYILFDIRYAVVGHIPGQTGGDYLSGAVLLEVRAEIQPNRDEGDEEGGGSDDDSGDSDGDDDPDDRLEPVGPNSKLFATY